MKHIKSLNIDILQVKLIKYWKYWNYNLHFFNAFCHKGAIPIEVLGLIYSKFYETLFEIFITVSALLAKTFSTFQLAQKLFCTYVEWLSNWMEQLVDCPSLLQLWQSLKKLSIFVSVFEWQNLKLYQKWPFGTWQFEKIGILVNSIIQKLKN